MLPERVVKTFHRIRNGTLFPNAWLATADSDGWARVRTVRVCGFNVVKHLLYSACDATDAKCEQLSRDPRAEYCLLCPDSPVQLRLKTQVTLLADGPVRDRFWSKVSEDTRLRIYGSLDHLPPWNYQILEASILEVDLLDLEPERPEQIRFRLDGDQFLEVALPD